MNDDEIINRALDILGRRLHKAERFFKGSVDTKDYLKLKYAEQENEVFNVLYLNSQWGLISLKEMFQGTVDTATIYPREVVKTALQFNAAAVILSHNHPSGCPKPSLADKDITQRLCEALRLIDVKVLDHIVVGGTQTYSFAEHGLL